MMEVLSSLVAMEVTARRQRALQRRIIAARLPKVKTLAEYKFDFPKRIPKQKIVRLFDCEFIEQHQSAVLIGPTGVGKTHLLTALGSVIPGLASSCSDDFAADPARPFGPGSRPEVVSGPMPCLTPDPRSDQRSVIAAPKTGRSSTAGAHRPWTATPANRQPPLLDAVGVIQLCV